MGISLASELMIYTHITCQSSCSKSITALEKSEPFLDRHFTSLSISGQFLLFMAKTSCSIKLFNNAKG
jgi:hypothetical protein